jgi:hydrogenase maturation factor HypF (carbamoyltransferase family)
MAEMFVECIAYGNLHIWSLKNAGKFKDYVNKNKQTFDVAHSYNGCSSAPHYATMVVAVRLISLQVVAVSHMNNHHCSVMPHAATTL